MWTTYNGKPKAVEARLEFWAAFAACKPSAVEARRRLVTPPGQKKETVIGITLYGLAGSNWSKIVPRNWLSPLTDMEVITLVEGCNHAAKLEQKNCKNDCRLKQVVLVAQKRYCKDAIKIDQKKFK